MANIQAKKAIGSKEKGKFVVKVEYTIDKQQAFIPLVIVDDGTMASDLVKWINKNYLKEFWLKEVLQAHSITITDPSKTSYRTWSKINTLYDSMAEDMMKKGWKSRATMRMDKALTYSNITK